MSKSPDEVREELAEAVQDLIRDSVDNGMGCYSVVAGYMEELHMVFLAYRAAFPPRVSCPLCRAAELIEKNGERL